MKVYLAARYSRRDEMRARRDQLARAGHIVTSCWLDQPYEAAEALAPHLYARIAKQDLADLWNAEAVIAFTEPTSVPNDSRGGRHVEFGLAVAWHKAIFIVGPRENIFHYLVEALPCRDFDQALRTLNMIERRLRNALPRNPSVDSGACR